VGTVSYQIQLPDQFKLHDVFHVSHLKKHNGPNVVPNPKLPLVTDVKLKVAPLDVIQCIIVPRSAGEYDVAVPHLLIHWEAMTDDEAWVSRKRFQNSNPEVWASEGLCQAMEASTPSDIQLLGSG
jgi:hypothetical protein